MIPLITIASLRSWLGLPLMLMKPMIAARDPQTFPDTMMIPARPYISILVCWLSLVIGLPAPARSAEPVLIGHWSESNNRHVLRAAKARAFDPDSPSDLRFERLHKVGTPNSGDLIGESDIDSGSIQVVVLKTSVGIRRTFNISVNQGVSELGAGPFTMEPDQNRTVITLPIFGPLTRGSKVFQLILNDLAEGAVDCGLVGLWDNRAPATLDYSYFAEPSSRRVWSYPSSGLSEFIQAARLDPSWEARLKVYTFWALQSDGTVLAWKDYYSKPLEQRRFRTDGSSEMDTLGSVEFPGSIGLPDNRRIGLRPMSDWSNMELVIRETNGTISSIGAVFPYSGGTGSFLQWMVVKTNRTLEIGLSLQDDGPNRQQFPEVNGERLHGTTARLLLDPPGNITAVRQRRRHRVVRENEGVIHVEVRKLGAYNQAIEINYSTRDGTAKRGADYESAAGRLYFGAGETTKVIDIPIMRDSVAEPAESFFLDFDPPGSSATPHHEITIQDAMSLEWRGSNVLRIRQPAYRTHLWTSASLSRRGDFRVTSPVGGFLTQAADYIDIPLSALNEGGTPEQFFILGTGDDDDVFNLVRE